MKLDNNYTDNRSLGYEIITNNSLLNGLFASITNTIPDRTESISRQVYQMSHEIIMNAFHKLVQTMLSELNEADCVFGIDFLWKSIKVKDLWLRLKEVNVYEYLDKLTEVLNSEHPIEISTEMFFINQNHIHFQRSM